MRHFTWQYPCTCEPFVNSDIKLNLWTIVKKNIHYKVDVLKKNSFFIWSIIKFVMFTMRRSLSTPSHEANRLSNRNLIQTPIFQRRRSNSTSNCVIEKKRGFKPSDRFDPAKREFLVQLGRKFWCRPVRNSILDSPWKTYMISFMFVHQMMSYL